MAELGVPASGRIAAGELADEGRVIGRLSDIGWGTRLRELVDRRRRAGAAGRARRLRAGARRVGVGDAAGRGRGNRVADRPHQLAHLARRIAEIGRLPLLGVAEPVGPRPEPSANSAQRLAAVWDGFDAFPTSPTSAGRCCWSTT